MMAIALTATRQCEAGTRSHRRIHDLGFDAATSRGLAFAGSQGTAGLRWRGLTQQMALLTNQRWQRYKSPECNGKPYGERP
jgi:hypothetical protein